MSSSQDVFKGKSASIRVTGLKEALAKLRIQYERGKNIQPVWKSFLQFFKEFVGKNWNETGAPYGLTWKGLKSGPGYQAIKKQLFGASGRVDLILTGRLKRAATGGPGWFEKVKPLSLEYGIKGIPYANIHQKGGETKVTKRQRAYFFAKYYEAKETKLDKKIQQFYLNMAITKKTRHKILQRPYIATTKDALPGRVAQYLRNTITRFCGVDNGNVSR